MVKALLALVPSLGVLLLFVLAMRAMLHGDRRERAAQARWDKQHAEPGIDPPVRPMGDVSP
jgi:hypothetical protein